MFSSIIISFVTLLLKHIIFTISILLSCMKILHLMIALLLLFTVYPHNINYQKYKHYKNKNWFRLQLIQPSFHSLKRERESERESVKHSIWLFIYLYTYLLHYLSHLYYIPVHYRWDRGESVLCTYVPHIVVLCTCVRTPLTCLFTYVNIINQLLFNFKAIHNALITAK